MSDGDLAVKFFILWRFLPICGVIFILSLMRRKRKKIIAILLYYLQGPMNRATAAQKRQLFRDLKYAKGSLKILEIGAGAGANFQFYHSRTKVTCLEPNEEFKAYILQNGAKTGLSKENITMVRGYAENMDMLAADSFDAVVCTFVLCSVRSTSLVLQEVKRVLKPVCSSLFHFHFIIHSLNIVTRYRIRGFRGGGIPPWLENFTSRKVFQKSSITFTLWLAF